MTSELINNVTKVISFEKIKKLAHKIIRINKLGLIFFQIFYFSIIKVIIIDD